MVCPGSPDGRVSCLTAKSAWGSVAGPGVPTHQVPFEPAKEEKDQKRLNRVDLFELVQIFYGEEKMPLSKAVSEVSAVFDVPLTYFGSPYYAIPKEAVSRGS